MLLDIIVIALFVLIVILGVSRGASKMVLGVLMTFVAFLAASWLGKLIAGAVYNSFFAEKIGEVVQNSSASVGKIAEDLPWWAEKALHMSGKDLSTATNTNASQLTEYIESAVRPIVVGFTAILVTLVLFFVFNLLLHKLAIPALRSFFKMPVVSTVDKLLGGLIGALEAVLIICMLAYILKLVLPYIDTNVSFLNETTIYNSFIFYHFYSGNIFTVLTSWIG